jgi:hypothetical protein
MRGKTMENDAKKETASPASAQAEITSRPDPEARPDAISDSSLLSKDDTLVKPPITFKLEQRPKIKKKLRWGHALPSERARLLVWVQGHSEEPILIGIEDRIVIGRSHPTSDEKPDLDLAPYGAHLKGVSRRHAAIIEKDGTLRVMDLNSTNGTYLNGTQLLPHQPRILRDGDDICLGQLVFGVSYRLSESE